LLTNIIGLPIKIFIQLTFSPNIFLKVHGQIFSNALAKYLPCEVLDSERATKITTDLRIENNLGRYLVN
jgi:hypothetical protein